MVHAAPVSLISRAYRGGGDGDGGGSGGGGATRLAGHVAAARNVAGPPHSPGAPHGRPLHGGSARRRSPPCVGGVGRLNRGRARATEGLEQRLAWPRLGGAPAPVVPRRAPSRSAHRPASPRQAAAERDVVEKGAVLRLVVGHESAPMARRARPAHRVRSRSPSWVLRRARDDSGRRSVEALTGGSAHPSVPRMDLPGGRPYPGGRGGPRSASAGAKAGGFLNHPAEPPSMNHPQ